MVRFKISLRTGLFILTLYQITESTLVFESAVKCLIGAHKKVRYTVTFYPSNNFATALARLFLVKYQPQQKFRGL